MDNEVPIAKIGKTLGNAAEQPRVTFDETCDQRAGLRGPLCEPRGVPDGTEYWVTELGVGGREAMWAAERLCASAGVRPGDWTDGGS